MTIILLVVLYGWVTWCLALMKEYIEDVSEQNDDESICTEEG
jgi:hypothetical protein